MNVFRDTLLANVISAFELLFTVPLGKNACSDKRVNFFSSKIFEDLV